MWQRVGGVSAAPLDRFRSDKRVCDSFARRLDRCLEERVDQLIDQLADEAVLDLIFGTVQPAGKLPFELPSSTAAVLAQKADLPYDSGNPLFEFGAGLRY